MSFKEKVMLAYYRLRRTLVGLPQIKMEDIRMGMEFHTFWTDHFGKNTGSPRYLTVSVIRAESPGSENKVAICIYRVPGFGDSCLIFPVDELLILLTKYFVRKGLIKDVL